jgi:hypothetical protein
MRLEEFDRRLRSIVPQQGVRPFVCIGSPLDCSVFIVGLNPATKGEFWPYWTKVSGFDKKRWLADYKEERRKQRKLSGKKTQEVSPTRRIIERVVDASQVKCLETNLYAVPTASIAELKETDRSTACIEFLLDAIKPQVLLLHGGGVAGLGKIGILDGFTENTFRPVATRYGTMTVCAVRHFSRGWSHPAADELGHNLGSLVLSDEGDD